MHFQPLRKSFGVLFTAFPDTLRAFRLLRGWQHRALLRCDSDQGCGRANGSGGYGRSACARATDALLAAKVSIAAMRIPTAAATTLSNSAFAAMWMLCIAPTPASTPAK